jgi:hypothetical protein
MAAAGTMRSNVFAIRFSVWVATAILAGRRAVAAITGVLAIFGDWPAALLRGSP